MKGAGFREIPPVIHAELPIWVFHSKSEGGTVFGLHWHMSQEILYVREGQAFLRIGYDGIAVTQGDIVFVNSGVSHSGHSSSARRFTCDASVYDPSLLLSHTLPPSEQECITNFLQRLSHYPARVGQHDESYGLLKDCVTTVIEECDHQDEAFELVVRARLLEMIALLYRHYRDNPQPADKHICSSHDFQQFQPLFRYVEENYHRNISVNTAAQLVGLSPSYFCRKFKAMTGTTLTEFINLYRVNTAEKLLRETPLSVANVSKRVGFRNASCFYRVFKQHKGYTPAQSREINQIVNSKDK